MFFNDFALSIRYPLVVATQYKDMQSNWRKF